MTDIAALTAGKAGAPRIEYTQSKEGAPIVRYFTGSILYEEGLVDTRWIGRNWSPIGRIDLNPPLYGDIYQNHAFEIVVDGQTLHRGWEWVGFEEAEAPRPGQKHAVVTLHNTIRPVTVKIHTIADGTTVFTRWLEIVNTGETPAALSSVHVWSGRVFPFQAGDRYWGDNNMFVSANGPYSLGYYDYNFYANEGSFGWRTLGRERLKIGEYSGKSGFGHPLVYLRDEGAGHMFVAQLAWSGNWQIDVEPFTATQRDPRYRMDLLTVRVGPLATAPMRVIAAGETVNTPEAHIGAIHGSFGDMVRQLHDHQRRSVLPAAAGGGSRLVSYNHWSYMNHEMDEEKLKREIDIAAFLGAELFTIDAGWYGDVGVDWWNLTGNWRPGNRLPNGFKPVFDYARSKGLKCGLWCWIEAVSSKVPIAEEHPDWMLERDGKRLEQLLDLSKPEAAAWAEAEIVRMIEEYEIDLFRIDYNTFPAEGGYNLKDGYAENTLWRHYESLYAIWDRIRARFPHVIIENCASGGGRTDLGMISRTHFTWFSDYVLAPRAIRMLNGMLFALPPETLARACGIIMNGHLGGDLATQLRQTFLTGNPALSGIWPAPEQADPLVADTVRHTVDLFKDRIRPLIADCHVYVHNTESAGEQPEGWCVLEYGSPDKSQAAVGIFRLAGAAEEERNVKLQGLRRSAAYEVWFDNGRENVIVSGADLTERGVVIRLPGANTSELLLVREVASAKVPAVD